MGHSFGKPAKVVVLGLENSFPQKVLWALNAGDVDTVMPSIGLSVGVLQTNELVLGAMELGDLSDQAKLASKGGFLGPKLETGLEGFVWVVRGDDAVAISEYAAGSGTFVQGLQGSRAELERVLALLPEGAIASMPILIVIDRASKVEGNPADKVMEVLRPALGNAAQVHVAAIGEVETPAADGAKPCQAELTAAFKWLTEQIDRRRQAGDVKKPADTPQWS